MKKDEFIITPTNIKSQNPVFKITDNFVVYGNGNVKLGLWEILTTDAVYNYDKRSINWAAGSLVLKTKENANEIMVAIHPKGIDWLQIDEAGNYTNKYLQWTDLPHDEN